MRESGRVLTISQLAAYAGVTVRAVRHYHHIGLLPEPERDSSGYRSYDAAAVVRLIRIHTLADAGVPLARVQQLLDANPDEFTERVREIDERLRAQGRQIQLHRKRINMLSAGDHLALPQSVVGYLDRLRGLGIDERYIEMERDAWIMVAAQSRDGLDGVIAAKHQELDDPDMVRLYRLLSEGLDWPAEDPRLIEVADIMDRLRTRAIAAGNVGKDGFDDSFVALLDATMAESAPAARRLVELMEERGWKGWIRFERVRTDKLEA